MSSTNTTAEKLQTSNYISFLNGLTYSIDAKDMMIQPMEFQNIVDVAKFGTELSIDGYEYSVHTVQKISYESDLFKKYIERAHDIHHYSHNISIYLNKYNRAIAIRLSVDDEIILVELF